MNTDECISRIRESCGGLEQAEYFLNLAQDYHSPDWIQRRKPTVIVLGTSFPPEILHAFTNPFWVIGGSRAMTDISDDDVPRDTDPISRSMLGYLQRVRPAAKTEETSSSVSVLSKPDSISWSKKNALVIVPFVSDSQRKLAYILKDQGWNVEPVHFPPNARDSEELNRVCGVLRAHCKKRFVSFKKSARLMDEAREAIENFTIVSSVRGDIVTPSLRMLTIGSFFMAPDVSAWISQLQKFTAEISRLPESPPKVRLLVVGSPIYFSCYKIPFLLEDSGLDLCGYIEPALSTILGTQHELSGAYIRNEYLRQVLQEQIENLQPDGILWHILKGQIEYDFELLRLEERIKIPVFRLETDYQYQDVEQLRVRMEAFGELLSGGVAHERAVV